jgi:hypothetical protein
MNTWKLLRRHARAANVTTLEGDGNYIDLTQYDEKRILPAIKAYCEKNPGQKPISAIDDMLNTGERIKGAWKKGTVKWAAD